MNRKWIVPLLAISMLAGMSGCGTSEDSSSKADETSTAENSVEESVAEESSAVVEESSVSETDGEFAVTINGTNVSKDYQGEPVLVVEYNFTNNSDKAASFVFSCDHKAFQNGIECDSSVIGCDEVDSQQQMNDIQPGTTYALKIGYHLQDTTTPVDIQVGTYSFLDEALLLEQTITL